MKPANRVMLCSAVLGMVKLDELVHSDLVKAVELFASNADTAELDSMLGTLWVMLRTLEQKAAQ
jgi:hypothetical protein